MERFDPSRALGSQEAEIEWDAAGDHLAAVPSVAPVADGCLDDLIALAADALDMPAAALAVGADGRQRMVLSRGLRICDAPIAGSAFVQALASDGPIALSGADLLAGAPELISFAGAAVPATDGTTAVLCLYDHRARGPLNVRERRILAGIARQIAAWFERRVQAAERERLDEAQRIAQRAANVGIYVSESDGHALCSPEFYEQLGLPIDTPRVGALWLELVHPDDQARVHETLGAAIAGSDKFDCDFRVVRADTGDIRWISSRSKIERDAAGNPVRAIGANIDITDRKLAQIEAEEGRNLLRSVIDQSSDSIFVKDLEHRFVLASEKCLRTIGFPVEAIEGAATRELFPPDVAERLEELDRSVFESGETRLLERTVTIGSGEPRILQTSVMPWHRGGKLSGLVAISRDVTEEKTFERALRDSEERFRLAAQAAGLGIWDFDPATGAQRWSDDLTRILGLPAGTPVDAQLARALIHPDDRHIFDRLAQAVHGGQPNYRFEATLRLNRQDSGEERWISTNGWKTLDEDGALTRVIVTVLDVTKEKAAERDIRWSASHDALTGLANRLSFNEAIAEAVAFPGDGRFGLLLLDLDHFKQVNDTLGHDAGDALLKSVARRLRAELQGGELVARLGGDEFAIILRDVEGEEEVAAIASRLIERLSATFSYQGRTLDCRASIGATLFPDFARTTEDLLKTADLALYAAKGAGRGKMAVFRPAMMAEQERRTSMLLLAREAIDEQRVTPHYQPKIELGSGKLVGFEALLRWWKPGIGIQPPGAIAAAFEDHDLASALSERMFDRVIEDVRGWLDAGLPFGHVAVNAAAAEFQRDDFAERILGRLDAAGVPPRCIEVEVTETVFLDRDASRVERALDALNAAGVKIALDDFGTGYASLSHLKQFPVDTIKIDRSFLPGLTEDTDDAAIVRAVLTLGHSLGIAVVAEGIETAAQAAYLQAHGCDIGQGFFFAHPLPAARVPRLASEWSRSLRRRA